MELNISKYIDYTLLKADAGIDMFKKLCSEAAENKFYSVCVPPYIIKACKEFLVGSDVKIATVISFPLGYCATDNKVAETKLAIGSGADEIDCVMNISAFKSGDSGYVEREFALLRAASENKVLKVIIETCCLTPEEIASASRIAAQAGADFVKTSTGYGVYGARTEDIKIIKDSVPAHIKIKASGGIKTLQQAVAFIEAGASRIGTSSLLTEK